MGRAIQIAKRNIGQFWNQILFIGSAPRFFQAPPRGEYDLILALC
jgi:hypothetical protein